MNTQKEIPDYLEEIACIYCDKQEDSADQGGGLIRDNETRRLSV